MANIYGLKVPDENFFGGNGAAVDTVQSLQTLTDQENGLPSTPAMDSFIDTFQTDTKGTQTNLTVSDSSIKVSPGQMVGTYERNRPGSLPLVNVGGVSVMSLQAIAPANVLVTSNTFTFSGNVTEFFPTIKNVVIANKQFADGDTIHTFLVDSTTNPAQLSIVSATYSSGPDQTTVVVSNPSSLILDFGISVGNYNSQLRIIPFDYQFQASTSGTGNYETLIVTDIAGTDAINIAGESFISQLTGLTGSVLDIQVQSSQNRTYVVAKVLELTTGNSIYHWYYSTDGGNTFTQFGSTRSSLNTLGETTYTDVFYELNPGSIFVANNGKMFSIYAVLPATSNWSIYGVTSDLTIGTPVLTDTPATGTDAANDSGATPGVIARSAGVDNFFSGYVAGDPVDLSWVAVSARFQTGSTSMYIRSYTSAGTVFDRLSSAITVSTTSGMLPPMSMIVTGTGTSHRVTVFYANSSSSSLKYLTIDQGSSSISNGPFTIETNDDIILSSSNSGNNAVLFFYDNSNSRLKFVTVNLGGATTISSVFNLTNTGGIVLDFYNGDSNNSGDTNLWRTINGRAIIDPNNVNHAFFSADMDHPDSVSRATIYEVQDVTNYAGVTISQYSVPTTNGINDTSSEQQVAQTFTASSTRIDTISVRAYQVGTIGSGYTLSCQIQQTSGGVPNGTVVSSSSNTYDPSTITKSSSGQFLYFNFPTQTLTGTYALVLIPTYPTSASNYLNLLVSNANPYASGQQANYNGSVWSAVSANDLAFEIIGDYVSDLGNALQSGVSLFSQNQHNTGTEMSLIDDTNINLAWMRNIDWDDPMERTLTGHTYRRELTINAGGLQATESNAIIAGYSTSKFDPNLALAVSLGDSTNSAQINNETGVISTSLIAEDRSGLNPNIATYGTIGSGDYVADGNFQSGFALNFSVSGKLVSYETHDAAPWNYLGNSTGINPVFAIEFEVKPNTSSGGIILSNRRGTDASSGWTISLAGTNQIAIVGTGGTLNTQTATTLSSGTYYVVKITGNGATVQIFVNGVEGSYLSQNVSGYTVVDAARNPTIGDFDVAGGSFVNAKIGYLKWASGTTSFAYVGYKNQAPLTHMVIAGNRLGAKQRVGENAEILNGAQFNNPVIISANASQAAVVDSNDLVVKFNQTLSHTGSDLWLKATLNKNSDRNLSSMQGINIVYPK